MSRKTGAYLEGRCRLAGITGGGHLKDREIERRLATGGDWLAPQGDQAPQPNTHPSAAHSTYHPASTLTSTCHPRGTAICLFYPGTCSALGVKSRRPASWNGAAASGTRVLGRRTTVPETAAERRLADGAVAPERRGAASQHVAQQLNTYRTTARRQHLAQGPGRRRQQGRLAPSLGQGAGAWPSGLGEDDSRAARAGPGRRADGDAGRRLAEGPGSQGAGWLAEGWRGWRRGLAGGGWAAERSGGGAVGRRSGRAAERSGGGAVGRRGGRSAGRSGGGAVGRRVGEVVTLRHQVNSAVAFRSWVAHFAPGAVTVTGS